MVKSFTVVLMAMEKRNLVHRAQTESMGEKDHGGQAAYRYKERSPPEAGRKDAERNAWSRTATADSCQAWTI
jgi:hypothetical protein